MIRKILQFGSLALALAGPSAAYDQALHERMSKIALAAAAAQNDFYGRMGMTQADIAAADRLIQHGAYDEDDTFSTTPIRTRNHFFDPQDMHGLTMPSRSSSIISVIPPCSFEFTRANDWAVDPAMGNGYDVESAKSHLIEAMFGPNPGSRAVHREVTFESLGHVVHLVEDMAQPEHTRNDQHIPGSQWILSNGTAASIWEEWSAAHFTNAPDADFGNYPVVKLRSYRQYFSALGVGMADYSNRNFFTQDTNEFDERPQPPLPPATGCYLFARPIVNPASAQTVRVLEQYYIGPFLTSSSVDETYYAGNVDDQYTGAVDVDPAQTVKSVLDFETQQYGVNTYSLNEASYRSRGKLLIPRAVGYAAGIIDYFFRGRIKVIWTDTGTGTYRMVLTNQSSEAIGSDAHIAVLYKNGATATSSDDLDLVLTNTPLSSVVAGFTGIAPGGSVTINNIMPRNLLAGHSLLEYERRIVLIGTLGAERNAVIPLVQPGGTGLRVVMKWTDASNGGAPIFTIRENHNFSHLAVFYNFNQFRDELPNATLTVVSPHEAYFRFDPIAAGGYFMVAGLAGTVSQCGANSDVTVEWWAYGQLVSSWQPTVSPCTIEFVGSYP